MGYKAKDDDDDRPFASNKCPTPEEVIGHYLSHTDRRVPAGMPSDGFQAARWWIAHQSPHDDFTEAALPPSSKGGEWQTPYHDRLMYTLKKFLRLKSFEQVYVIEHIEKGVPWKGDDIKLYTEFVNEWFKMQENPEQYVKDGFLQMSKVLKGMTDG